jgi:hypothetical protein
MANIFAKKYNMIAGATPGEQVILFFRLSIHPSQGISEL